MDLQTLAAAPVDRRAAAVANMEGTECCVGSPRGGFPEREAKGLIWPSDWTDRWNSCDHVEFYPRRRHWRGSIGTTLDESIVPEFT